MRADAATVIQRAYREYAVNLRLERYARAMRAREDRDRAREAEVAAHEAAARALPSVLARVAPVVREATAVMAGAYALVLLAPPPTMLALPADCAFDEPMRAWPQIVAAIRCAVPWTAAFVALLVAFLLLFEQRWHRALLALHSLYICAMLALPFAALLLRCAHRWRLPLDGYTLAFATWNFTIPALIVVHWPPTERRFDGLRRGYSGALSMLLAWALLALPWQPLLATLVLLTALDLLIVLSPCSPVVRADRIRAERRAAGEAEFPGLTYKAPTGLELGLGDFIAYAALVARAAHLGNAAALAAALGVTVGLVVTMARLALATRRTILPALPLSITLGIAALLAERVLLRPLAGYVAPRGLLL